MDIEFHFQEGFSGQELLLFANDIEIGKYQLKTRLQTGLAAIEKIELDHTEKIRVALPALGIDRKFSIETDKKYILVNLQGNDLTVTPASASPGYV